MVYHSNEYVRPGYSNRCFLVQNSERYHTKQAMIDKVGVERGPRCHLEAFGYCATRLNEPNSVSFAFDVGRRIVYDAKQFFEIAWIVL